MVETGLGLLSRCKGRTWSVIPLPKQGWVCYPTGGSSILLVSERLRLGWVRHPWRCYVENFTKLWACVAEVFECSRKRSVQEEADCPETDLHDCGVSRLEF